MHIKNTRLIAQSICCAALFSLSLIPSRSLAQVPPDKDGLLHSEGMGQAKYAEMNGYPGPKHVLELSKELQLTDAQQKSVNAIYNEMQSRAKELGERIIQVEEELHEAFKTGLVNDKSIKDDAEQIGRLRGKLRATHLVAHLKTKKILTSSQIESYRQLRMAADKKSPVEHKH